MSKIKELMSLCKASVTITINYHKDFYQSVGDYLGDGKNPFDTCRFNGAKMSKMEELDTIVYIQAYPSTPVGYYELYHYDIDLAIEEMIDIIKKDLQLS